MPFTSADATKHTKKATSAKLKRQWAEVANSTRGSCIEDGGDPEECDARAIRAANSTIAKEADMPELAEASKNAGDYLVVGDKEKSSTWHLQVKKNGKPDRALAGAAWAALFSPGGHRGQPYKGPDKAKAKSALKALYKAEDWEMPASEADVTEMYYDDEVSHRWSPATSFADLQAERNAEEIAEDLREATRDFNMIMGNVMWSSDIPDKVSALRSLFDEFMTIVEAKLQEPPDMEESDLEESAAAVSLQEIDLAEMEQIYDIMENRALADLTNARRFPVLVEFSIIKPGHGNKRDKNYYPAETLATAGPLFEGADIYVTDHNPNEKGERTKVGRFRTAGKLTESGLVSTAIIYDPDVAEKTRNRADAGELGTLHCSIFASGTGRPGTVDGQEVTVIEKITDVVSVDLVSRAGAGGQALSLAESHGGTMTDNQQETPTVQENDAPQDESIQEVEIREDDATGEETPVEEVAIPAHLEDSRVQELLDASGLPEDAKSWLIKGAPYLTEDEVQESIAEMQTFIKHLAPEDAGQPFGLGETSPKAPEALKVRSQQEMEADAQARFRGILERESPSAVANIYG